MTSNSFVPAADGTATVTITDDLEVRVNPSPTVTIVGFQGAVTLDFDDTVDVADALINALAILRSRGAGTAYPERQARC